jgi:hypothetical protein
MEVSLGLPKASSAPIERAENKRRLAALLNSQDGLRERLRELRRMGTKVKSCEVHLTNKCNIRCKGCWYFEGDFDSSVRELTDLNEIRTFAKHLADNGVTQATLIGGEPSLVLDRVGAFVDHLPYLTVSTNGLRPIPRSGLEHIAIAISLFGGGPLDDALRAHKVNGRQFTGLFETALRHYAEDDRVLFIFALSEDGVAHIEDTVRAIRDNGNLVTFNYYSEHGSANALKMARTQELFDAALGTKARYPDTVVSHEYFIKTLITGRSHWGAEFGYDVCPSISVDLPEHAHRVSNGNPVIDGFSVYGADYQSLQFCCTSGHCNDCRDSQAVYSWLLLSMAHFTSSLEEFMTWLDIAESYWRQWHWARELSGNFARVGA